LVAGLFLGILSIATRGWLAYSETKVNFPATSSAPAFTADLDMWWGLRTYSYEIRVSGGSTTSSVKEIADFQNPLGGGGESELKTASGAALAIGIISLLLSLPSIFFLIVMYRAESPVESTFKRAYIVSLVQAFAMAIACAAYALLRPISGKLWADSYLSWSYLGFCGGSICIALSAGSLIQARRSEFYAEPAVVVAAAPAQAVIVQAYPTAQPGQAQGQDGYYAAQPVYGAPYQGQYQGQYGQQPYVAGQPNTAQTYPAQPYAAQPYNAGPGQAYPAQSGYAGASQSNQVYSAQPYSAQPYNAAPGSASSDPENPKAGRS
jgi:hypothetical protein